MARWLMKFEVEAHLGVESKVPRLIFKHPTDRYEVHLENNQMEPGCEVPLLNAFLLFDSETLQVADNAGKNIFEKFLDFLVATTGMRFRIKRRVCLFDWSPGVEQRDGYVYQHFADPNFPQLLLNPQIASVVESLLVSDVDPELMQALHWFAAAVSAELSDEQFELFWFTIETLARYSRSKEKVPDLCARCREPLYCRKCQEVSTHRPYPTQAIAQLFAQHVPNDADCVFRMASAMRHALLHGDEVARVEKEYGLQLSQLSDLVGQVAWVALFSALARRTAQDKPIHFELFKPSTFLHYRVIAKARIGFHSPAGREPEFTDIPIPKLDLIVRDASEGETDA